MPGPRSVVVFRAVEASGEKTAARPRRAIVYALVVLAAVIGFLAVFSIWVKRQALETDNWVQTSSELLEDPEIRTQLADFMTDTLYANVNVEQTLSEKLPPDLKPLAGPASAGLRQLTNDLADKALQQPRVQQAWEEINRAAHQTLISVIEDDSGQPVTIDLGQLVGQVASQVGLNVADKIPADAGQITILPADKLSTAQKVVNLINKLSTWLTIVALLLFGLAIYLARGWRRVALRSVGFAFVLIGLAVIVTRNLAGDYVVNELASTASVKPAVSDAWTIGTSLLDAGGGAMIVYGILIVLGAWLAAPGGVATSIRRTLAPILENRVIGYGALLFVLLLLFWWSPTEGFQRLLPSVLIIALMIAGFEALRHQAVKEFPHETWEAGSARWRESGRKLGDRVKDRLDGDDK